MSIVIASALVLADAADGLTLDHPLIGYHNVVTSTSIAATEENSSYPVSNLANPATHLKWLGTTTGEQHITVTTNYVDEIDYVGVAGHNWSSGEIPVSIEAFIGGVWTEIVEDAILSSDGPALFRFDAQSVSQIRIRLQAGSEIPTAAVVYVGKLLVVQRKIYVGHTPLPHGRKSTVANGRSESGNFLGRIVLGSFREATIPLSLISPAWYRANMDPFLADAQRDLPFFFAWRPQTYPGEVGYCFLIDDPVPTPAGPSNLIAFDLKVRGVV